VVEYTGERISDEEAARRHPADPADPHHTFYFSLEGGGVIDARHKGNSARWINHACAPSGPNCEAAEVKGRVFIHALRDIEPGEELFYDYHLTIDERLTPKLKRDYACRCGAASCRGTLLQPKRR
jgi:SET domain-containing protein